MQIFIGETSAQDVEVFGSEGLLEHRGEYFNLMVEYGSNAGGTLDVVISDGVGRSVPVSVEYLFQLCKALSECANIHNDLEEAERLQEFVQDSDNVAVVCNNGHIHY